MFFLTLFRNYAILMQRKTWVCIFQMMFSILQFRGSGLRGRSQPFTGCVLFTINFSCCCCCHSTEPHDFLLCISENYPVHSTTNSGDGAQSLASICKNMNITLMVNLRVPRKEMRKSNGLKVIAP